MSIFLFTVFGFIVFFYSMDFWNTILQPEISMLLPFIGATIGAVLGYYFQKNRIQKLSFLSKSVDSIVALLFLILGSVGSLLSGSLVFKYLFSNSYCKNNSVSFIPCGGSETMFLIFSIIILAAGIFGMIASKKSNI